MKKVPQPFINNLLKGLGLLLFFWSFAIVIPKQCSDYESRRWIEFAEEKASLDVKKKMLEINSISTYEIKRFSPRPLWPIPGIGRSEVHHLVLEVFPLEGGSFPHQVHKLKNVESGIIEVGILLHPKGFHQGAILKTTIGEIEVLSEGEADAILRKFGRKK